MAAPVQPPPVALQAPLLNPGDPGDRQPLHRSRGLVAAAALAALAVSGLALALLSPNRGELQLLDLPPLRKELGSTEEMIISPEGLAQVPSVAAFNEMLATSAIADAAVPHGAIAAIDVETLLDNFLETMGSEAPDASGAPRPPRHEYSMQAEREARLDTFKTNLLEIMRLNYEEYTRNPHPDRARFGITVHADWTREEFQYARLSMRASNTSALKEVSVTMPESISQSSHCERVVAKGCFFLGCHSSRGPTYCVSNTCVCQPGYCARDGKCIPNTSCPPVATTSGCHWFGCHKSRGPTTCTNNECICEPGFCAHNGVCLAKPEKEEPGDIQCSKAIKIPVRDQGQCGDCWAFTTAEQLRYQTFAKYRRDTGKLSVQYLVDCMPEVQTRVCQEGVKGCCGGLPIRADLWLASSGGIPTTSAYGPLVSDQKPFVAFTCKDDVPKSVVPLMEAESSQMIFNTETRIANAFCSRGSVAIAVYAEPLQHYIGGLLTKDSCRPGRIDHAVLVTGIDKTFFDHPVHIVQNSWGPNWGVGVRRPYSHAAMGDKGHMLFKFGDNACNIKFYATAPGDVELL